MYVTTKLATERIEKIQTEITKIISNRMTSQDIIELFELKTELSKLLGFLSQENRGA